MRLGEFWEKHSMSQKNGVEWARQDLFRRKEFRRERIKKEKGEGALGQDGASVGGGGGGGGQDLEPHVAHPEVWAMHTPHPLWWVGEGASPEAQLTFYSPNSGKC